MAGCEWTQDDRQTACGLGLDPGPANASKLGPPAHPRLTQDLQDSLPFCQGQKKSPNSHSPFPSRCCRDLGRGRAGKSGWWWSAYCPWPGAWKEPLAPCIPASPPLCKVFYVVRSMQRSMNRQDSQRMAREPTTDSLTQRTCG